MYYFAYGSNMNEEQMRKRCSEARFFGVGVLADYQLDFTISAPERWRGGGCADVVEFAGGEVWGLIYIVTPADEEGLDRAEGTRYQKIQKLIKTKDGKEIRAFLYEVIDKAPFKKPASQYLDIIKKSASLYGFPEKYKKFLDSIETDY